MKVAFVNGFILGVALTAAFFAWRLRIRNDREMESWIRGRVKTLYALGYDLASVRAHFSRIMTILLACVVFSFVMIGVAAQQPKPQKAEIPRRVKLWCSSQSWLAEPKPDGGLQYHFIGEWTQRQKIDFVVRCDPYNRSIPQKFAHAQQPAKPLTPEEESEAAQRALIAAGSDLDRMVAAYNTARANRDASLYKLLSERGIKASECVGPGPDSKPIPFACVTFDASGKVSVSKPKAVASPSPKKE